MERESLALQNPTLLPAAQSEATGIQPDGTAFTPPSSSAKKKFTLGEEDAEEGFGGRGLAGSGEWVLCRRSLRVSLRVEGPGTYSAFGGYLAENF